MKMNNKFLDKTYDLFRYNIPTFLKNVWIFRKALYNYHSWDYSGVLLFLKIGLIHIVDSIGKYSNEIEDSKSKKIKQINRAIQLIDNCIESPYIDIAENELGKLKFYYKSSSQSDIDHNHEVLSRADEIETGEWVELWRIIQGPNYKEVKENDGSDIRGWWY
jgi:hypothetical protein